MPNRMRLRLLIGVAALPLVLWGFLPLVSSGQTSRIASIQSKIEKKRAEAERVRGRERVLVSDVVSVSRRINTLQSDISTLQARQIRIQADLDAKRAELERIQEKLRLERARLARLKARLVEAKAALAQRLVELYKADKPDVVTVILEADGFADLLERSEFMKRVSDQDKRIIDRVRVAKAEATATEARLQKLEGRQKKVAAAIEARRDEVARVRGALVDRRDSYAAVRDQKQTVLARVRVSRRQLEQEVAGMEREQARIAAALQRAQAPSGSLPAGPVRPGSGRFIWPVNGPLTSPFGPRWGRLHAGIDISAPGGTPIRAADAGRVVIAAPTGGYGLYTCISHGGALSTCYAHQSGFATSQGASVSKGQVIGYVGNTGNSFGNHLHFEVRVNGSPVDPAGYL